MQSPPSPSADSYAERLAVLAARPRVWLVTGAAGFIGSHLVERLLVLGQEVRGLDDLSTGSRANLDEVARLVGSERWARFRFSEADVCDARACAEACAGAAIVLHQAALGSVSRSIRDPLATHKANVEGFLCMALAAREAGCERLVYASSSSVYGDQRELPQREGQEGRPLSPYAASKGANELYAAALEHSLGLSTIGLRYFNVFGPRQSPSGPYAAVFPRWIEALLGAQEPVIFGDGKTTRDFCPVDCAVQANLLAAAAPARASGWAYNVALGRQTSLLELFELLRTGLAEHVQAIPGAPRFEPERPGDLRHSQADLTRAHEALGYQPCTGLEEGIARTLAWSIRERFRQGSRIPAAGGQD